jgi:hypothetical protein
MDSERITGSIVGTGTVADLAVSGPDAAADPSRLARASMYSVLGWLAVARPDGVLRVACPAGHYDILVRGGVFAIVRNPKEDFMGRVAAVLADKGVVTQAQLAAARRVASESGPSAPQALFAAKACTPTDIVRAMAEVKAGHLKDVITARSGSWEWRPGAGADLKPDPTPIDVLPFVASQVRALVEGTYYIELEPLLQPRFGLFPVRAAALGEALCASLLSEKERKVSEGLIDGTNSLLHVVALSLLPKHRTARLVVALEFLGLIEYRRVPLPKGGVETLEKKLKATLEQMQGEDLFSRLGVHWTAHPDELDGAYDKRRKTWGPDAVVRQHSQLCGEIADRIMTMVDQAYAVLRNARSRQEYRNEITERSKMEFSAQLLFKQAHLAAFRGERETARRIIESAIDVLPKREFIDFRDNLGTMRITPPRAAGEQIDLSSLGRSSG